MFWFCIEDVPDFLLLMESKDKKGLDIRKPIIDYDKVKRENEKRKNEGNNDEVDPFDRNENTGIYTFQKTDERNRKQWENDSKIGHTNYITHNCVQSYKEI